MFALKRRFIKVKSDVYLFDVTISSNVISNYKSFALSALFATHLSVIQATMLFITYSPCCCKSNIMLVSPK